MSRLVSLSVLVMMVVFAGSVPAQTQVASAPLAFDAVVIRPSKSDTTDTSVSRRETTLEATNVSLKTLLVSAYGVRDALISGIPPWAESTRFDINAKVIDPDPKLYENVTREQRSAMLARLLEDRFHLKVHTEVKTLPVYELVVTKDGPKFKESAPPPESSDPTKPEPAFGPGSVNTSRTEFNANSVPLYSLVMRLSLVLGRPVIDKTGLTGKYTLDLKYTPEDAAQPLPADAPPSIFSALQEQLGLKLQSGKGPVDTLIVDHVEPPSEN